VGWWAGGFCLVLFGLVLFGLVLKQIINNLNNIHDNCLVLFVYFKSSKIKVEI
jgi:hypothetical protein